MVRGGTTSRGHDDDGRLLDVNSALNGILHLVRPDSPVLDHWHDAHAGDMAVTLDRLLTLHSAHMNRAVPRQIPWKNRLRVHNIT